MNTRTHLLLACAVLVPVVTQVSVVGKRHYDLLQNKSTLRSSTLGVRSIAVAALLGALIPDISLFVMWGVAKSQGIAEAVIWQDWYYSELWQRAGAITNSIPVYLIIAIVSWLLLSQRRFSWISHWLLIFSLAALLHVFSDFPLHHDDGHPHFWPFSQWIYRSPVSYWDPAHHGQIWSIIELGIAVALIWLLWRRFTELLTRSLLMIARFSYAAMIGYWWLAFR